MTKGPTVYDVAEAAGVSIATVSFTFRRPDRVRRSTREAVLVAARRLGYVPSASARGLAEGHTGVLGMISWDLLADVPAASEPFGNTDLRRFPRYVDEVQRGVELATWRNGRTLMIGGGNHSNSESVILDIAGRADGLVVLPHTMTTESILPIAARIPVVIVSEFPGTEQLNRVTIDNADGIRQLVQHLVVEHAARDIRFVGDISLGDEIHAGDVLTTVEYRDRWNSLVENLRAHRLDPPESPITHADGLGEAMRHMVETAGLPDALVCRNDADALDVMDELAALSVTVPDDVIVTGFDGIAAGMVSTPTLTTVRQPMQALGEAAVDILIQQLANPTTPLARMFPVALSVGNSCGCERGPSAAS